MNRPPDIHGKGCGAGRYPKQKPDPNADEDAAGGGAVVAPYDRANNRGSTRVHRHQKCDEQEGSDVWETEEQADCHGVNR